MKQIDFKYIEFVDAAGITRQLRGCPLDKLVDFDRSVKDLWAEMSKYLDISVADCYHHYPKVQELTNRCLEFCSIKPEWLSVEMMTQLLHQYESEEGFIHKGLLIEENLPHLAFESVSHQISLLEISERCKELQNLNKEIEKLCLE